MEYKRIGRIGNYYGGLYIMKCEGKYYWCIENHNTNFENLNDWDEIDKELYDSLIDYQDRISRSNIPTNAVLRACHRFDSGAEDSEPWEILMNEFNAPEKEVYAAMQREYDKGYIDFDESLKAAWLTIEGLEFFRIVNSPICNVCKKKCSPTGGIVGERTTKWKCFDCEYEVEDVDFK